MLLNMAAAGFSLNMRITESAKHVPRLCNLDYAEIRAIYYSTLREAAFKQKLQTKYSLLQILLTAIA